MRRLGALLFIVVGLAQGVLVIGLIALHLVYGTWFQRSGIVLYAVGSVACLLQGRRLLAPRRVVTSG